MKQSISDLLEYLIETLDVSPKIRPWSNLHNLPLFLSGSYDFYELTLLKQSFLVVASKEDNIPTPAIIKKHLDLIKSAIWHGPCVYMQRTISPHNRKRLIHHRIPFIIPGYQMYLPELGIDLRERYLQTQTPKSLLSPSTQAILIYALYRNPSDDYATSTLFKCFGYSRMTIIRAFDELLEADIGSMQRKGRERYWSFTGNKKQLWEQAQPFLRNPIQRCIWVKGKIPKMLAGLTALAEYSMLAPPKIPTYATCINDWHAIEKSGVNMLSTSDEATAELQIWHYDPSVITTSIVDPFSLYLSLKKTEDERIIASLNEMMESIKW